MGTTSEKLTYLNGTKSLLKDVINYSGAGITSETTFRNYAAKLYDGYVDILKNKYVLLDNMPKGQVEGISAVINNAEDLPVYEFKMSKESSQHTTDGRNLLRNSLDILKTNNNVGVWNNNVYTINGVDFIYNKDGSITVNGLASATTQFFISRIGESYQYTTLSNGTYYVTSHVETGSNTSWKMQYNIGGTNYNIYGSGNNKEREVQVTENTNTQTIIVVYSGFNPNGITFYPMIATTSGVDYEEYTGGQPSPNPDYPQEVKVVEGYRNLFDKDNIQWYRNNNSAFTNITNTNTTRIRTNSFAIEGGKTYTLSGIPEGIVFNNIRTYEEYEGTNTGDFTRDGNTFTLGENVKYIHLLFSGSDFTDETNTLMANANIQIVEGDQELPYVPYGNNYIAVNVSDGTTTNKYPIPLNNNIIAGIGDYKDELKVDKSGNVFINKKTGKIIFDGSESWSLSSQTLPDANYKRFYTQTINTLIEDTQFLVLSNYFKKSTYSNRNSNYDNFIFGRGTYLYINTNVSLTTSNFKTWLSTHNTEVYYALETPELIDLQTTVDINLFKGVNNISNSEDGLMNVEYVKEYEEA